jgi:gliding motility-associated-like protein
MGISITLSAQSLFNNKGCSLYLTPGSYMIVNNDSLFNHQGLIQNAGELRIAGDLFNTGTLTGGPTTTTGLYDLGGNWINSGTVVSYQDSVMLNGDVRGSAGASGNQFIAGSQSTMFHHLILTGTSGSVKTQMINTSVDGILDLRGNELATDDYEMLVVNPSPVAITKYSGSQGFVSSWRNGRLTRITDTQNDYLYPIGTPSVHTTVLDPFYYRPLVISPTSSRVNHYSARLVNNPTLDGFDVLNHDDSVDQINNLYYHRIYHGFGTDPASITLYYESSDGLWTDIAHFGNQYHWDYTQPTIPGSFQNFLSLQLPIWSNYDSFPFALATRKVSISSLFLIPTAFSPNHDGVNDLFRPINKNLESLHFQVYDRWGEKVYETDIIGDGWDGTYKNVPQTLGVYVWQAEYRFIGNHQLFSSSGNVTLVR